MEIDDAEYVETPSGDWFKIELEKGTRKSKSKLQLPELFYKRRLFKCPMPDVSAVEEVIAIHLGHSLKSLVMS